MGSPRMRDRPRDSVERVLGGHDEKKFSLLDIWNSLNGDKLDGLATH